MSRHIGTILWSSRHIQRRSRLPLRLDFPFFSWYSYVTPLSLFFFHRQWRTWCELGSVSHANSPVKGSWKIVYAAMEREDRLYLTPHKNVRIVVGYRRPLRWGSLDSGIQWVQRACNEGWDACTLVQVFDFNESAKAAKRFEESLWHAAIAKFAVSFSLWGHFSSRSDSIRASYGVTRRGLSSEGKCLVMPITQALIYTYIYLSAVCTDFSYVTKIEKKRDQYGHESLLLK